MHDRPLNDLFPNLCNGELPLSYLHIARMSRSTLPELSKRDRPTAAAPRHYCEDLPMTNPIALRGSVWFDGDEAF